MRVIFKGAFYFYKKIISLLPASTDPCVQIVDSNSASQHKHWYNYWQVRFPPSWLHPLLMLMWLLIGISLRLTNLTAKSPGLMSFPPWCLAWVTIFYQYP